MSYISGAYYDKAGTPHHIISFEEVEDVLFVEEIAAKVETVDNVVLRSHYHPVKFHTGSSVEKLVRLINAIFEGRDEVT